MRRGRALAVHGRRVWASRGSTLLLSEDGGAHFRVFGTPPMRRAAWSLTRIGERLARAGFHGFVETSPNSGVGVVTGGVVRCGPDGFGPLFRVRGSRPLGVTRTADGALYFGEYWGNAGREPVRIYQSRDDGESWRVAYEFPAGSIRHVHAVIPDANEPGTLFVLTGDEDHESTIYRTRSDFSAIEALACGTQQTRAIAAVPRPEGIYYATDTERAGNAVYLLRRDGQRSIVGPMAGSGFGCCVVGNRLFFATAVEPSAVNRQRDAYIYECVAAEGLRPVARGAKDALPMKLFQYGTFVLPAGPGDDTYLWTTPWALAGHGALLRMRLDD